MHHDHEHHHQDHDCGCGCHDHSHEHTHSHDHDHNHEHHHHHHDHDCSCGCSSCGSCEHTPIDELVALMKYMIGHNASHVKELADLAAQLEKAGSRTAYEQVMAAVSDFEKGNMRLSVVLAALDIH